MGTPTPLPTLPGVDLGDPELITVSMALTVIKGREEMLYRAYECSG